MSPRYVCPSMGAIGRPLSQHVTMRTCSSRSFHASARRLQDKPGDSASQPRSLKDAMTGASAARQPRRQRNANAATQVGNLSFSRPPPANAVLAKRSATGPPAGTKIITPRNPLVRKDATGASGTMVRAPSTLRITRVETPPARRPQGGPNLRARGSGPPSANGPRGPRGPRSPKKNASGAPAKREQGGSSSSGMYEPTVDQGTVEAKAIDNSLMQNLYRMQRNQWDRKPYEPKYAPGSFAANELIHAGRELFRGEAPPVKVWGKLEKTLNIVGMHGAASHLKVRRVLDGDYAPFGQETEKLPRSQLKDVTEPKVGA